MKRMTCLFLMGVLLVPPAVGQGTRAQAASGVLAGPVEARVLRLIDGDTFVAEAFVWPGHSVTVSVRIRGIDAPEMRGRCEAERAAAREARAVLGRLLGQGRVLVRNIGGDKYYGRVVADVASGEGSDVAGAMLRLGMAKVYRGKTKQQTCPASVPF
jgi:endonuclease YncB( thermonuclease family)